MVAHRGGNTRLGLFALTLATAWGEACGDDGATKPDPPTNDEVSGAREDYCETYASCMFVPSIDQPFNQTLEECLMAEKAADEMAPSPPDCDRTLIELRECLAEAGCDGIYLFWKASPERPCAEEQEANSACGED